MTTLRAAVAELPIVRLTPCATARLPEYSQTLPTGKTIGKRWKRNAMDRSGLTFDVWGLQFAFPWPPLWVLGEYVKDSDPGMMGIRWSRIEVAEEGDQCASTP